MLKISSTVSRSLQPSPCANAYDINKEMLQGSDYLDDAFDIAERFDKTTKLRFRDPEEPQYIKFGTKKDKDPRVGIRYGQIRLNGCVPMECVRVHRY
jgi:hypothetical protein